MSDSDIVGDIFGWVGSIISTFFFITPVVPFLKLMKEEITIRITGNFIGLFINELYFMG